MSLYSMSEALLFGLQCYLIYKEEIYIESEFKLCRLFFFWENVQISEEAVAL